MVHMIAYCYPVFAPVREQNYPSVMTVLGRFPLPIEITPFGAAATRRAVEAAAARAGSAGPAQLRRNRDSHAFVTDGGHWLLDVQLGRIADPPALGRAISPPCPA